MHMTYERGNVRNAVPSCVIGNRQRLMEKVVHMRTHISEVRLRWPVLELEGWSLGFRLNDVEQTKEGVE